MHADTIVPPTFAADIASALADPAVVGGRFDVKLDSTALPYRIIGAMISLRSRISRTGTGDQAIFVRRDSLRAPRRVSRNRAVRGPRVLAPHEARGPRRMPARSRDDVGAAMERDGLVRTVVRMWLIRAMYLLGVSPARLKRMYSDTR